MTDPFSYTPLKKRRVQREGPSVRPWRTSGKKAMSTQESENLLLSQDHKNGCDAYGEEHKTQMGHCCFCQMPLNLLSRWVSGDAHAATCIETPFEELPPCPNGKNCDVTIQSHYTRFNHFVLAEVRARERSTQASPESPETNETVGKGDKPLQEVTEKVKEDSMFENLIETHLRDTDPLNPSGHIQVHAQADSDEISIRVTADSQIALNQVCMKIPMTNIYSKPMPVECKVSRQEAKERFEKIFANKKTESGNESIQETKRKGYIVPRVDSATQRKCPYYKKIPNTAFCVDAFNYGDIPGVTKYFLSHFHYDHYQGLGKKFKHMIICSEITARLIDLKIGVNKSKVRALPLNQSVIIETVEVMLLDANHCPGAVMFLFKFPDGSTLLHCGDFRAHPSMEEIPALWNNQISSVYLDTTYCSPEYDFPSQENVISRTVEAVQRHLENYPQTLILVGSYTIGKERVFVALAEALDCMIWASNDKFRTLKAIQDPVIERRLTTDARSAKIHVVAMRQLTNKADILQYLELATGSTDEQTRFHHVLTLSPTGWKHSPGSSAETSLNAIRIRTRGKISSCDVPYSEHSSFSELRRFVKFLKLSAADQIIPTVNVGSAETRKNMKQLFQDWISDKPLVKNSDTSNFFTTRH